MLWRGGRQSFLSHVVLFTLLAVICTGLPGVVDAKKAKPDPRCYNLKKKIFGKRGRDWAIEWWQWALSIPESENPLTDETGARCEIGQRGPVWFLCGVFNESGVAVRTATLPTDTALFFPVLNTIGDNVGYEPPLGIDELIAGAAEQVATYDLDSLKVILDGSEIRGLTKMRVAAGPFRFWLPEGSVSEVLSGGAYTKGIYWPAVTDGYWVMLRALPAGPHTLRFTGSLPGFTLDITYELNVTEHDKP